MEEKLFELIEEGKTIVMPTEDAARSLMARYVNKRERAVSFRSVIAFDTFLSAVYKREKTLKKAEGLSRLLFSKSFIDEYSEKLKYFIPNRDYPEINERIVSYIASTLPSLEDDVKASKELREDIALLKEKYDEFLSKASLYEPSFKKGAAISFDRPYVLAYSSSSLDMISFYLTLEDKSYVTKLDVEERELKAVEKYGNEKQEIRNTFLKIKELIKNGVTLDRIILTVSSYDRLLPYLEREGYLFDIPLTFMRGKSALLSSSGSFFSLLDELYTSSYDISVLQKFFFNPAFPFREDVKKNARLFIFRSIDMGIKRSGKKDDRFRKADYASVYKDLRHYNDSINETSDPDYLINQIKSLMEKMFIKEQFSLVEEDERLFSFIVERMMRFSECVKTYKELGYLKGSARLYPLFIKYMKDQIYVPQKKDEGIKVYPLSQDAGIYSDYRFVIALNEKDGRIKKEKASFLSDYEVDEEREDIDVTKAMLLTYEETSGDITFSSSETTYEKASLVLTDFKEKKDPIMLKDSIEDESTALKNKDLSYDLYPFQKRGFEEARNKALDLKDKKDDMAGSKRVSFKDFNKHEWNFSASQLNKYSKCPYLYALDYIFHLNNSRQYEVSSYPAIMIGTALHSSVELYFKNGGGDVREKSEEYLNYVLSLWQDGKMLDKDLRIVEIDKSTLALSDEMRAYIYSRYIEGLVSIIEQVSAMGEEFELEHPFKEKISGYNFSAYADMLLHTQEGTDLIDFKSNSAPSDSYQIDIYRLLFSAERKKEINNAMYAVFKDGTLSSPATAGDGETIAKINEMADGIEAGDFHGVNSSEECKDCEGRRICRRRFFVR